MFFMGISYHSINKHKFITKQMDINHPSNYAEPIYTNAYSSTLSYISWQHMQYVVMITYYEHTVSN